MKKLILIITVAALFGSCKKEYTCECETDVSGVNCVDSLDETFWLNQSILLIIPK